MAQKACGRDLFVWITSRMQFEDNNVVVHWFNEMVHLCEEMCEVSPSKKLVRGNSFHRLTRATVWATKCEWDWIEMHTDTQHHDGAHISSERVFGWTVYLSRFDAQFKELSFSFQHSMIQPQLHISFSCNFSLFIFDVTNKSERYCR
jgi:hypothetical protein